MEKIGRRAFLKAAAGALVSGTIPETAAARSEKLTINNLDRIAQSTWRAIQS